MSKQLLYKVLSKMFTHMNELIESRNYNLLDEEVQNYSRRLDRFILIYNKKMKLDKVCNKAD